MNAHHALKRLADTPEPPTLAELLAISPCARRGSRSLNLFSAGILREDRTADTSCSTATRPPTTGRMAGGFRERDEPTGSSSGR